MSEIVCSFRTSVSGRVPSNSQFQRQPEILHGSAPYASTVNCLATPTASPTTPYGKPGPRGSVPIGWLKHIFLEGNTLWDALLLNACSNIGQVLLVWPHQMANTGITPGLILMVASGFISSWTMWLLLILYMQRKHTLMGKDQWFDDLTGKQRLAITQYHEVVGFFGHLWLQHFAQLLTGISLLGTGIAQVVACAGNYYSIDQTYSKRTLELIFGGCLMAFTFVPSFRQMRILNIIGIIGTAFTAWYIVGESLRAGIKPRAYEQNAAPKSMGGFFVGLSVLANAGHANSLEMVDTLYDTGKFIYGYGGGIGYAYFLVISPSVTANLAFPKQVSLQDNVFGILPRSSTKVAAVWLMIVHQFIAFSLYVLPLLFMWEKLIRTHTKAWYIRLPSRLPIALLVWLLGVMFPYYATINSFFAAVTAPFVGVIIPCLLFNWHYRTKERQTQCPIQPWRPLQALNWWPIFLLNVFLACLYLVAFTGFGIYFNIVNIVKAAHTFGIFPACYQCATKSG
ncbi:hypothetical protein WJX84_001337 [Apatococcus fuscideae]|uniref:Amino acid transporter transmembrane domain-containing protein n=1 Tax=Apatococcus fuscideae TaxID=2026836 RepID=A0AAW1THJ7_9CHLO